jgi:hypothetical protein
MGAGSQWRWRVANAMDLVPGQCWSSLAGWALCSDEQLRATGESRLPWRPVGDMCRTDLARAGSCYCNKLDPATGKARHRGEVS